MRITEEQERRAREKQILDRLPGAVDELEESVKACLDGYTAAFPGDPAEPDRDGLRFAVTAAGGRVEVTATPELPGFEIASAGATQQIQIGILPGDRLFYLDVASDRYLSMEELTKRILDRVLFPKLKD
jgi:hypothetical protein